MPKRKSCLFCFEGRGHYYVMTKAGIEPRICPYCGFNPVMAKKPKGGFLDPEKLITDNAAEIEKEPA